MTQDQLGMWLGIAFGVLGIAVAVWYGRKRPVPAYAVVGNPIVSDISDQRIKIVFIDYEVPRLTRSRVVFWNAGRATLRREDLVSRDPISFHTPDGAWIHALKVIGTNSEASAFRADLHMVPPENIEAYDFEISFDYVEPRQGVVVEILHDGETWDLTATGTIKGVPKGVRRGSAGDASRNRWLVVWLTSISTAIVLATTAIYLAALLSPGSRDRGTSLTIVLMGAGVAGYGCQQLWYKRRVTPPLALKRMLHGERPPPMGATGIYWLRSIVRQRSGSRTEARAQRAD